MKVILIEGEENTGKSTLFRKILKELVERSNVKDEYVQDFWGFYEIEGKKVILNSFSDDSNIIEEFKEFYEKYKDKCDVLVTAIRPDDNNNKLREDMKKVYEQDKSEQEIVITLKKIRKKDKIEQDKYLEEKYDEFLLEWNKI
ncbi:GTPase [Capnocytophaga canimorsus]|uniref:G domain-containing protein n=1 Tax=Capnocytophaga canimorsus (strain 5) TaxID=860228 RepID=F9YQK9_CAPCC|nr:GTPase [Capnocytophaga canimorsus]AEK23548.1 Conserved hypothetical protein [Capnocytophaga canimorsus Cc5]